MSDFSAPGMDGFREERLQGAGKFSRREVGDVDQEPGEHVIDAHDGIRPGRAMVRRPGRRYGHLWEPAGNVVSHWETREPAAGEGRTYLTVLRCAADPWAVGGMANSRTRYAVVIWRLLGGNSDMCRSLGLNPALAVDLYAMGELEHVTTDESARMVGYAFAGMVARGELAFPPETERDHGEWRGAADMAARTA